MTQDQIYERIPTIDSEKRYWFIRTFGGETFSDYYDRNYVGLGVNNIPQSLIKSKDFKAIYNFLETNTQYKNGSATKMANELISFEHEIKIGDTVIIPSKDSKEFAIGLITSDVKTVKSKRTFTFKKELEEYPEKRRDVEWINILQKDDFSGDLKGLTSSHHGLTNADQYEDIIEGRIDSLYIKNKRVYYTLKINQDEDINAFILSRFLNGLTYFYHEWCKENEQEIDEELYIKIRLQSKGTVAMKALCISAVASIALMIAMSDDMNLKIELGKFKTEGHSGGFLKSLSNFLDKNQERKIQYELFKDSIQQLKAMRYDDSLKKISHNIETKGE